MDFRVLIVDDEKEMCVSLSKILASSSIPSDYTTDPQKVRPLLEQQKYELIIMDIKMPRGSGLDLLEQIRATTPHLPVIMISGYPSVDNIVSAMKGGALNFYQKPIAVDKLLTEIGHLSRRPAQETGGQGIQEIRTRNPRMAEILRQVRKIADTNASVIITGESGTGKELIANAIHSWSSRSAKPFVKMNCASIPDSLLESELFGYEPGAFTDAKTAHRGRFELAHGGSLFLDEIGDMSLEIQAKILRVLQEKEFERLGGTSVIKSDVRVIAATNRDIQALIAAQKFREDLFYRLSVITISLPPLRERREDIPLLVRQFLDSYCASYRRCIEGVSPGLERLFLEHQWPGNVRELKNCIERAVIFNETGELDVADLPSQYHTGSSHTPETFGNAHDQLTRQMILDALARSGGVKHRAADLLKIHRKTLYNQMKRLGIE